MYIHKSINYFGIELGTYFYSKDVFLWVLFKTNKGKIAHSGLGLKNGRVRKCEADSSHEWLLTPWPQKLHFCSQTSLLVCSSSSAHWTEIAKNCSKIPCQYLLSTQFAKVTRNRTGLNIQIIIIFYWINPDFHLSSLLEGWPGSGFTGDYYLGNKK